MCWSSPRICALKRKCLTHRHQHFRNRFVLAHISLMHKPWEWPPRVSFPLAPSKIKKPSAAPPFEFVCSGGPRHVLPGLRWPSRLKAGGHTKSVTNIIKRRANKKCSNRFAGNKTPALPQNSATNRQTSKSAENSPRAHLAKTCMQIMKQGNRYKMEPGRFNAPPNKS